MKLPFEYPVAAAPTGSVVGTRTAHGAAQEFAAAGSFQVAKLAPAAGKSPTEPPKFTEPFVALSNDVMTFAPLVTIVGYVKFQNLNPTIGEPVEGSLPFGVLLEINGNAIV